MSPTMRGSAPECGAQAPLVDPPVVVLAAVHERDRDLLGVLRHELLVLEHRPLLPADTQVVGHPRDDLAGVVAQVAAGLADQGDAWCGGGRHLTTVCRAVAPSVPV